MYKVCKKKKKKTTIKDAPSIVPTSAKTKNVQNTRKVKDEIHLLIKDNGTWYLNSHHEITIEAREGGGGQDIQKPYMFYINNLFNFIQLCR